MTAVPTITPPIGLNLLANLAGVGWSAIIQLTFIPLYVKFLGIEAFGLIGFNITLQSVLQVLDFGLSPTMNREMARYSINSERAGESRDFVRTLEVGYWVIGIVIGFALVAMAPFVATKWFKAVGMPANTVRNAIMIMGGIAVFQWPLSFYQGGLMGLQRQTLLNGIRIVMASLSSGGAVLVLWLVSPTIIAFFSWQVLATAIHVALVTIALWRSLPSGHHAPRFTPRMLRSVWRFALGMSGITASALILTQLDKVMLSKLLDLRMFGYYMLAVTLGNALYVLIAPVFNSVFPRFSQLVAVGDHESLNRLYHRGAQVMSTLVLPLGAVLALFSFDILSLWTRSAEAASNAAPIVSVLVIGTALNGFMNLPYALQLAHGWTSIGLRINTFLILLLVPAIIFMTSRYGPVGAAAVWAGLNMIYVLLGVPLTHARLLKGEARRWFTDDVGLPLAAVVVVTWVVQQLMGTPPHHAVGATTIAATYFSALLVAVAVAPEVRTQVWTRLNRLLTILDALTRHRLK